MIISQNYNFMRVLSVKYYNNEQFVPTVISNDHKPLHYLPISMGSNKSEMMESKV